jgi:hypothetical protein
MKISKLSPINIFASKASDYRVTLFYNKKTDTICYKDEEGNVIEVGSNITAVTTLTAEAWDYKEVALSNADMLALVSTKEILAAPGTGKYYDINKVILEYTAGGVAFNIGSADNFIYFYFNGEPLMNIDATLITTLSDQIAIAKPSASKSYSGTEPEYNQFPFLPLNTSFKIGTWLANPTLGTGTGLVKVWYKTRTFGTEL